MAAYQAVIGLEVHAQLSTKSKLFCSCPTAFGAEPNRHVCEVCCGMPGVLPVLNKKAVELAVKAGLALGCEIQLRSIFARKNYFYPDLPKAYQISQYEEPVCQGGSVEIETSQGVRVVPLTRIHMEEDAGKSIHAAHEHKSYVDLNRAGVPLIEIVSEPAMHSAEEAAAYLKALHAILVYLGVCDGNMEEGSFRCDANISLRPVGETALGTRTELKNLNSFRNVQRAIEFEIARQQDVLDDGDRVIQETRLFDADKNATFSMRGKEEAHDYRYFPDPDLAAVQLDQAWVDAWKTELPELPRARRQRFIAELGLPPADADMLTADKRLADYLEAALASYGPGRPEAAKKLANWIMGELVRELNAAGVSACASPFTPAHLAELVECVEAGTISGKIGKQIFPELFAGGASPKAYIEAKGLVQISDSSALETEILAVIAANPKEHAEFKAGKTKLMGFFVGQVMRRTKGQANPALVNELLAKHLNG
ncbi:Asp-tRNA(Asn)/Glu-tRNA(Gln) amidotransferase subunit GatB [Megalodesulfovibrio gigas]|uniref:Aspartyl/glutamyl-tRNA(Asn/Gln) amidotransferase subunit B n=1 Tax=Megalodesulfovibrio gigas (strain ATCC 19364 / DSM 1382 / NCIMB 9332 / VKM B-1759) TaxID=1121448 RepID=T2GBN5_MEGG1|nr:Asp-tRNA(Asn)/Glu-tRNA(Gln) amidotransferase subunit GatB [Megalodesulfovibrio gigas]AGW13559.1 putative Aspartyl/glutamyl-tRNA(Asn/Gln) amidotransferase subunit B [Megalodesulfovibrio gigas DSM 1382 = ATCC 19364]